MDQFKIGKGVHQGCILSPCLFNLYAEPVQFIRSVVSTSFATPWTVALYAEYIMQNAGLDEAQAGIKIAGRNINNLRYADDSSLMAESEEELKSLLMKVKEESEKADLKLRIQEMKIMASGSITLCQIDGETMVTVTDYCLELQNHCRW